MAKCDNCDKTLTKKSSILECNKCSKIVHANQICTGLSAKQLAALRNTENLEWTCEECRKDSPRRKSFVALDEDDEEDEEIDFVQDQKGVSGSSSMKKLLSDISTEVKKAVKKEMSPVQEALHSCCQKIDEVMETLDMYSGKIKELEKKNIYLMNQNKHLELKIDAMEQQMGTIEQKQLCCIVEIAGVPEIKNENPENLSVMLAAKLNSEPKEIINVKRLRGRNGKEGVIHVLLKQENQVDSWIRAARKSTILVEDISDRVDPAVAKSKVMIRRALSAANKTLLWQTKVQLKETHKYIWFQDGKILVRENDSEKPMVIRSIADLEKYAAGKNKRR